MSKVDPEAGKKIDDYIQTAPEYAHPILTKLRQIVHDADPEILEDWKWGPNFNHNGMVCGFGAGKSYVKFTFFQGALIEDKYNIFLSSDNKKTRSINIHNVSEINAEAITEYIKLSVENNIGEKKVKIKPLKDVEIPQEVLDVLDKSTKAKKFFEGLANSYKKEYIEWITSAKREATREKRKLELIEKLEAGERLHEKYMKCK